MEIVINIPDEIYNTKVNLVNYFGCYSDRLDNIIYGGTPIPKGHGRLIDADDVYNALRPYVSFSDLYDVLDEIPTIIEDNGGE